MKVTFLEPAATELDNAINFYEAQQHKLGFRFESEVEQSVARIAKFPESYQEMGKYSRRCLVHKFPYSVIYIYKKKMSEIVIIAIANLHRKPEYWLSREGG